MAKYDPAGHQHVPFTKVEFGGQITHWLAPPTLFEAGTVYWITMVPFWPSHAPTGEQE
ncbi:hypothetical protein JZU69_03340 [bacterium]|nr:hypothetical protein [bacterium]